MNCGECKNYLFEFLDDELDERTSKDVEVHFASCPSCLREKETLSLTLSPLRDAGRISPDEHVWHRIRGRILQEKKARWPFLLRTGWIFSRWPIKSAACAAGVLVILGLVLFQRGFWRLDRTDDVEGYLKEVVYFLAELDQGEEGSESLLNGEEIDLGTSIEMYFLSDEELFLDEDRLSLMEGGISYEKQIV